METKKLTNEEILKVLREHNNLLEKYRIKKIGLFGSYVRGEQKKDSDIDFLVEFEKPDFDNFMDLAFYLEDLFGKKIDILTPEGVRGIRIKKIAENIERGTIYV
ncbi:MAG: nucleotidyltransferase family protein [Candidatus Desantisbacteria bacterium]